MQSDAYRLILKPRELEGAIDETGADEDWIVGPFVQTYFDFLSTFFSSIFRQAEGGALTTSFSTLGVLRRKVTRGKQCSGKMQPKR